MRGQVDVLFADKCQEFPTRLYHCSWLVGHPAIKASVQYLCNISKYDYDHDKDDFLHEDKNQSFLQVYSIIFTGNR